MGIIDDVMHELEVHATSDAGALIEIDGRVVLRTALGVEELSAQEIFRIVIRGDLSVRGRKLAESPSTSAPGIYFHPELAAVAMMLTKVEGTPHATAVVRHRGMWVPLGSQPGQDHKLVERDWYPIDPASRDAAYKWMAESEPVGTVSTASYFALYSSGDRLFEVLDELDDHDLARLSGAVAGPPELNATLYPYQVDGLEWLSARAEAGLGGILADEMGLGKTLQLIGLIVQRLRTPGGPVLIIVPLTLVENWTREFAKFAPGTPVYRHVGPRRSRRPAELSKQGVVLTTYETVVIDEGLLGMVDWDMVIADEAQALKNPDAQRTRSVGSLRRRAAFAVTGTPLENRTQDVWSLASLALPGYLGTRADFASRLEADPQSLRMAIRPLMLRREVKDVAKDLPDKITIDSPLEMFAPEAAGYDRVITGIRAAPKGSPALALITKLRLYTAHPDAVNGPGPSPESRSAKLTRLLEIVDEILAAGQKVLIFVAFNTPAAIVSEAVRRRSAAPVWVLDGGTPVSDRQPMIDRFSNTLGGAALVLNPIAGGVGLNIQAARHVIHYTLEWNPAREAQATARAWRRGQQYPVTVHRLFYANSIDEFILEKLAQKQDLFDEVVQPSQEVDASLRDLLERTLNASLGQ